MDANRFWMLVAEAKAQSQGDCNQQVRILQQELGRCSEDDIAEFDYKLGCLLERAYRRELWMAAEIIMGGCSDDAFAYFRAWLIGQGREVYNNALADPETLVDVDIIPGQEPMCEAIAYAASRAYKTKTGNELESVEPDFEMPEIEGDWDEANMAQLLPRLYARYSE
jgi:hypothetical protein